MIKVQVKTEYLDQEWVTLMAEARRLGITKDEVRQFLNQERTLRQRILEEIATRNSS